MLLRRFLLPLLALLLSAGSLFAGAGSTVNSSSGTSDLDDRANLEVSAYGGFAVDTFLAEDVQRYLNYDSAVGARERGIGGVDFAYRFNDGKAGRYPGQLWIFGETLYGVRSTEIDCSKTENKTLSICGSLNIATLPDRTLYIMRNASSIEGSFGLRYEFLRFHALQDASANLYVKSQLGFQSVAKGSSDVADDHTWLALGSIVTKGDFKNSYFEVGRGRSDVFRDSPRNRWKIDGYVEFPFIKDKDIVRPFIEMYVNVDGGRKADSIQTFIGFSFDIKKLHF